ncbi:hypothetical protein Droror1_Dr00008345 [Drosera rotundifolia]
MPDVRWRDPRSFGARGGQPVLAHYRNWRKQGGTRDVTTRVDIRLVGGCEGSLGNSPTERTIAGGWTQGLPLWFEVVVRDGFGGVMFGLVMAGVSSLWPEKTTKKLWVVVFGGIAA